MDIRNLEKFTLPGLFAGMQDVARYNSRIIKRMSWKSRTEEKWSSIFEKPVEGSYPLSYWLQIGMPMYVGPNEIDYAWEAALSIKFTQDYFNSSDGSGVLVSAKFKSAPFHHHAKGHGKDSRICIGNTAEWARNGDVCNLTPYLLAMLNRDKMACCMKSGHYNWEAFEHWKLRGFKPISPISFFGAKGVPINRTGQDEMIPFIRM